MAIPRVIVFLVLAVSAFAEPPSPYHYNKPQQPQIAVSSSNSGSYKYPAPQQQLTVQQNYQLPSASSSSSFSSSIAQPAQHQPIFAQLASSSASHSSSSSSSFPSIPSTSYGFPQQAVPAPQASSVSVSATSNDFSGLDNELRTVIEQILLKEETRASSEFIDGSGTRIVSISMEGPTPALSVANFVHPVQVDAGFGGPSSHVSSSSSVQTVGRPAPAYGAPF